MKAKAPKTPKWNPEEGEVYECARVGNAAVKIYRRFRKRLSQGERCVYEVADYTAGVRKLHGFRNLVKARAEADRIARQLASGEVAAARMISSEAASYGRAVEILRPTGLSLEMAATIVAKCVDLLGGDHCIEAAKFYASHRVDRVTPRLVKDVVVELVESKRARGKSDRYIKDLEDRLSRFAESNAQNISAVTTPDVQRWLDNLKGSAQTAKNYRTVLYTLFQFAEARGYTVKGMNPVAGVERISVEGGAVEIFTPEEMAKLLKASSKPFLPVLLLGGFAGLRSAEIQRLEWSDIDHAAGLIHVAGEKAKTRSRRLVPILPNLATWLSPYARRSGRVWRGGERDMSHARSDTAAAAGVVWKNNGLRHSFVSYRLADIQNAAQVALEAGNSPTVVFQHYRELVKPEAAKAWFAITQQLPGNVVSMGKAHAKA